MVVIPARQEYIVTKSYDQMSELYETNITKGFGSLSVESYNYVNTVARALIALTTNTYNDSNVIMTKSVNDALSEDE